jgi:hypothetical protein
MKTVTAASALLTLLAISTLRCARAKDPPPPASPASPATAAAARLEGTYEGAWVTTKSRKLDGTASCEVTQLSKDHWRGRFTGQWQQTPFDYTVEFNTDGGSKHTRLVSIETTTAKPGPVSITGKAEIDGIQYEFAGLLSPREFTIQFTGDRYEGAVLLKRVQNKRVTAPAAAEPAR